MTKLNYRQQNTKDFEEAFAEVEKEFRENGKVEILSGPTGAMIIDSPSTLRSYKHKLFAWYKGE